MKEKKWKFQLRQEDKSSKYVYISNLLNIIVDFTIFLHLDIYI